MSGQWVRCEGREVLATLASGETIRGTCVGVRAAPSPKVRVRDARGREHMVAPTKVRLVGGR